MASPEIIERARDVTMSDSKPCAACNLTLPQEKFSKKQWQAKKYRRCKECVANNKEAEIKADGPAPLLSLSRADGKGASAFHPDEALFKKPPPYDVCPTCSLPLPIENSELRFNRKESKYQPCCGKNICMGCIHAALAGDDHELCPFCKTPKSTSEEESIEWIKKRAVADDAMAIHQLGYLYDIGSVGLPQDLERGVEMWLRAGELGCATAYYNVGHAYHSGRGVDAGDTKTAKYYWELAAMGGDVDARYNLGTMEKKRGNHGRAIKHFIIAAGAGDDESWEEIRKGFLFRECYLSGHVTKDDYEKAQLAHQTAKDEMSSEQRKAAAEAMEKEKGAKG